MFTGKLVKKNGKLVYSDSKNKTLYDIFINNLKEGEELDIFISICGTKASGAQITKVHTCIRVIAMDLGYSFEEMKLLVKQHAGLCIKSDNGLKIKSFSECSSDEITLAIETAIQIGENFNINLK